MVFLTVFFRCRFASFRHTGDAASHITYSCSLEFKQSKWLLHQMAVHTFGFWIDQGNGMRHGCVCVWGCGCECVWRRCKFKLTIPASLAYFIRQLKQETMTVSMRACICIMSLSPTDEVVNCFHTTDKNRRHLSLARLVPMARIQNAMWRVHIVCNIIVEFGGISFISALLHICPAIFSWLLCTYGTRAKCLPFVEGDYGRCDADGSVRMHARAFRSLHHTDTCECKICIKIK